MKKLLRTANKPLSQISRCLHEKDIINKKAVVPPTLIIVKQKKIPHNRQLLLKLQYRNCSITAQQPNDIFMLNNDTIIKIVSLSYHASEDDVKITGVR